LVLGILVILGISVVIGGLIGSHYGKAGGGIAEIWTPPFGGKRIVRVLMLGEDDSGARTKSPGLSDSIFLLSLNLDTNQVSALSIPRDTLVDLDGYGKQGRINGALKLGGPTYSEKMIERLIGVIPDYYLHTNLKGFRKTVDLLGGVQLDVEKDMHYTDNWGNLHINLKKGVQWLDGEHAMEYVRFRHDKMGDITRMQRQQKFMKALAKRAVEPVNLAKLPLTMQSVMSNIDTNLTVKDLVALVKFSGNMDMSSVKTAVLPEVPQRIGRAQYMVFDSEKAPAVIQDLFFSHTIPGLPTVEVLNGTGVSGAGQKVADALKQQGYDVSDVKNADSFDYKTSEVISHKKDVPGLDKIAQFMNSTNIKQEVNPKPKVDVTIIVGRDCALIGTQG
jgi:LCP family protein required for cell wall assembly